MAYKYTHEGCFKGELLKEPPLPIDNPDVVARMKHFKHITRRWYHNGCAMEELGRFGTPNLKEDVALSAFVWHIKDILGNPQHIVNNDGVGAAGSKDGKPVFVARFVTAALTDYQINNGIADALETYFGFKQLAPFFGNCEYYGNQSRIGLYGVCCTRYIVEEKESKAS